MVAGSLKPFLRVLDQVKHSSRMNITPDYASAPLWMLFLLLLEFPVNQLAKVIDLFRD